MAQKRMFSKKIIQTDAFMDMPQSSQLLYFHMVMEADDDGFIASPKRLMKSIGSSDDDYKVLIAKRFLLPFESGVCVVKHWWIHNTLYKDRYRITAYSDELKALKIKENGAYTENVNILLTNPSQMLTQTKLNQTKLNQTKLIEEEQFFKKEKEINFSLKETQQPTTHALHPLIFKESPVVTLSKVEYMLYGEFNNVKLTIEDYSKLIKKFGENNVLILIEELSTGIASKGYKYKSHYAALLNWGRRKIQTYQQNNKPKRTIV